MLIALCVAAGSGCATPTPPSSGVLKKLKEVPVYEGAPCPYQRQWSESNTRLRALKTKEAVTLVAPCDWDEEHKPKSKTKAAAPPKTS